MISILVDDLLQGGIDPLFADHLSKVVKSQTTFLVMDVTLVQFDIHQGSLLELLRAPGSEVSVHFVAEEFMHHVVAIGLAHDHQCGVLRKRFRQKRCTLDLGSDDLVGPPLVSHFVSDDVSHHIDVIGFL